MEKGVFLAQKKDGQLYYRSSFTYNNKHISLGSFNTELEANLAYIDASDLISENFSLNKAFELYNNLPFDKVVSLCNFRDNGLYSPNPIYVSGKTLYYYLSLNEIYKFDLDDLFFYAKHKIQKRGGHLFVADCGKQINIASRYGIKNNAVLNKDYAFVNGDKTDYRYSNIEIYNIYQGVESYNVNNSKTGKKTNKKQLYKAYIHINGNYIIGIYDSIEKAAIAYNKAVDILKEKGINKNFTKNTISKISAKKYNSIYDSIEISEGIVNL